MKLYLNIKFKKLAPVVKKGMGFVIRHGIRSQTCPLADCMTFHRKPNFLEP
jgi:hypothetical protein